MKIMKSIAQTNLSLKPHISMEAIEPEGSRVLMGSDKLTWPLAISLTLGKLFNLAKLGFLTCKIGIIIVEILRVDICHSFFIVQHVDFTSYV